MYSGRVIVPLNAVAGESALSYVIEHSDSRLILVDDGYRKQFATILESLPTGVRLISTDLNTGPAWPVDSSGETSTVSESVGEDDTAVLIYTSGTTGRPKGVLLTHANVVAGGRNTAKAHELTERDRGLCVLPLYHINAEMVTVMGPLVSSGSVVMPYRYGTATFWETVGRHDCTWFSVVPTIIAYLLEYSEREGLIALTSAVLAGCDSAAQRRPP